MQGHRDDPQCPKRNAENTNQAFLLKTPREISFRQGFPSLPCETRLWLSQPSPSLLLPQEPKKPPLGFPRSNSENPQSP